MYEDQNIKHEPAETDKEIEKITRKLRKLLKQ